MKRDRSMLRSFFRGLHYRFLANWDHRTTLVLGGAATISETLDILKNVFGLVAIMVAIYCSLARNSRERRAAEFCRTLKATAKE